MIPAHRRSIPIATLNQSNEIWKERKKEDNSDKMKDKIVVEDTTDNECQNELKTQISKQQ